MRLIINSSVFLMLLMVATTASATSVTAIALFKDRAMLSVDGSKAKIVKAGSTYKGVTLISSNTSEAVVEVNGQRDTLTLNGTATLTKSLGAPPGAGYGKTITLYVNGRGFFESNGTIDGRNIGFLIDTGANIVVLSSRDADRIGLEYRDGVRSMASTASGTAPMFAIVLREVSLGGITLNNIQAGVIEGNFPEKPLLGMSFLNRLDMNRQGNAMELKLR